MTKEIPAWKLFLHRQLLRNQISTALCEATLEAGMDFETIGKMIGKDAAFVPHSLRPENINMDEIADLCAAMDVTPVLTVSKG